MTSLTKRAGVPVAALSALALAGCVEPARVAPTVTLRGDASDATVAAARAWNELGFRVGLTDYGQEDCPLDWHAEPQVIDCAIRIEVRHDPDLAIETGVFGLASPTRRIVWIDLATAWAGGDGYDWLAAHEVGHVVLDTDRHLEAPARGVMRPEDKSDTPDVTAITDDDRALACETIAAC